MRALKLSTLFLTIVTSLCVPAQANALNVGEKSSFAQMEKALKQTHQVEVARAKYMLNHEDANNSKELCFKITINADGEAYLLMSDNMDDSKATIEMIYGKIKNARVADPHNVGVLPGGVSAKSNLAQMIKRGAARGDGVFLHGQSVKSSANGPDAIVGLTTVMANVSDSKDSAVVNTVAILLTNTDDLTSLDKVVGIQLQFPGG